MGSRGLYPFHVAFHNRAGPSVGESTKAFVLAVVAEVSAYVILVPSEPSTKSTWVSARPFPVPTTIGA